MHSAVCGAAGMTNLMWMRRGMSVVQLIPYGWRHRDGRLEGADLFGQLAANVNCSHFVWENKLASNSWLNKVAIGAASLCLWLDEASQLLTQTVTVHTCGICC